MSSNDGPWSDLGVRIVSALVLVIVAALAIWIDGWAIVAFVVALCLAIIWEQTKIFAVPQPSWALVIAFVGLAIGLLAGPGLQLGVGLAAGATIAGMANSHKGLLGICVAVAVLGAFAFLEAADAGVEWLLWLIGVVVLTDVSGYFAGRVIGGPKLWPSVSPKKTWSGTLAGWISAAIFGWLIKDTLGGEAMLIIWSILVSMASQAGDLLESHAKRRFDTKDSSNLIPGHGGVWDRFDGMITGAIAAAVVIYSLGP